MFDLVSNLAVDFKHVAFTCYVCKNFFVFFISIPNDNRWTVALINN